MRLAKMCSRADGREDDRGRRSVRRDRSVMSFFLSIKPPPS
jgi:hypothetical protein